MSSQLMVDEFVSQPAFVLIGMSRSARKFGNFAYHALGMDVVSGECILMFARPAGFHKAHRWVSGLLGRLPA